MTKFFFKKAYIHFALAIFCYATCQTNLAAEEIPSWFPREIESKESFYATWQNVSYPGSVAVYSPEFSLLGGRLLNEQGEPLGNVFLDYVHDPESRHHVLILTTDKDGYFLFFGLLGENPEKMVKYSTSQDTLDVHSECPNRATLRTEEIFKNESISYYTFILSNLEEECTDSATRQKIEDISPTRRIVPEDFPKDEMVKLNMQFLKHDGHPASNGWIFYSGRTPDRRIQAYLRQRLDINGKAQIKLPPQVLQEVDYADLYVPGYFKGPITLPVNPQEGVILHKISEPARLSGTIVNSKPPCILNLFFASDSIWSRVRQQRTSSGELFSLNTDGSFTFAGLPSQLPVSLDYSCPETAYVHHRYIGEKVQALSLQPGKHLQGLTLGASLNSVLIIELEGDDIETVKEGRQSGLTLKPIEEESHYSTSGKRGNTVLFRGVPPGQYLISGALSAISSRTFLPDRVELRPGEVKYLKVKVK